MNSALIVTAVALGVAYIISAIRSREKADQIQEAAWSRKMVLAELRAIRLHRPEHIMDEPAGRREQIVSEHWK